MFLVAAVGLGGFLAAKGLAGAADTQAAFAPPTQRVVTVERTVRLEGGTETVLRTVTLPRAPGGVVTSVQRETVVSLNRGEPVTVTDAVAGSPQTVTDRVSGPGRTVTVSGPTQTVRGPTQTVTNQTTSPGREVTVTGPTRTVTSTVTQPAETIIRTETMTITDTVTTPAVTVTVTVKR